MWESAAANLLRCCIGVQVYTGELILVLEMCYTYATQSIQCGFDTLSKIIWMEIQDIFYV